MRTRLVAIALATFLVAPGGCTSKKSASSEKAGATPESSQGSMTADAESPAPEALSSPSNWRLTELGGKPLGPQAQDKRTAFLVFEREGNRIHGYAGCNDFAGNCEYLPGDRLRMSGIVATKKACLDMTVESEFLKVLETTDNYFTDGKVLKLHRARMAPLAVFEAVGGGQE